MGRLQICKLGVATSALMLSPCTARAQSVQELQQQINDLKAQVQALTAALGTRPASPAGEATAPIAPPAASTLAISQSAPAVASAPTPVVTAAANPAKHWYERLMFRGYTQMRYNAFFSGDKTAPAGISRLRSVHDSAISDRGGFSLRRARLVLQGDVTDNVSIYLQSDFASAVNNQSGTERREGFGQLRDAYVDYFPDKGHHVRLRFGQMKVPFGWENLQSSSNRLTLDRSDAINSAIPGERDIGVAAYYTPAHVQAIWDRLSKDGQKLFGNYGAFGVGIFNGQGTNRSEQNENLMKVALATWPFALDGLSSAFEGQVLELGGSAVINRIKPEVRTGGVSTTSFKDNHYGVHAILYPQPFGVQAEWTWGKGPEFDPLTQRIGTDNLSGGYVQAMYRLQDKRLGTFYPYGRWQRYRGGWKAAVNAPRLETNEIELGLEWQPIKALELTVAYARMKRAEADERRAGRAEGDLIRTQLQWNY